MTDRNKEKDMSVENIVENVDIADDDNNITELQDDLALPKMNKGRSRKKTIIYALIYTFLIFLVIICLMPFYLVIINATRSATQIKSGFSWLPGSSFKENWNGLVNAPNVDIIKAFINSVFVSLSVTLLSGYFSALTAYGFYLYKFRGKTTLFVLIIVMMMVPSQLAFLGFYQFMNRLGLTDSLIPLIIPAIASTFTVFFLRQYASGTVHKELIESSRIDGGSEFMNFHRIGLPLMMPGIATMSIFTFIGSWNNYLGARIIINSPRLYTLPLAVANLKGDIYGANLGSIYAGLAFSIVPIIIAFIFFSRYIIDSIAAGAVKG